MAAWVSRDLPNPNTLLERKVALSTKIYDRTGEHILYDIHGAEARTLIKLEDLPDYVKNSAIAIEDKNFYEHHGFVLTSFFRAALSNVFRGGRTQGGSTITQQFVKNAVLTPEKTYARKFRELILSLEIERRFTKDQILQLYFNEIPYGSTNYGIEAASRSYFGKSAKELSLAEAATLAGLPQAPTSYLNNPDRLLARRNLVLDLMVDQNYLEKDEAEKTKKEPLNLQHRVTGIEAPHFVLWVKQMLTEKYGERVVEQDGLRVITSLDYEMQKAAEEAVANGLPKIESYGGGNASLVAIDPKTGQILAMVGSRDYFDKDHDGAVNVALRPRQPGSSFKPIVYTAGFIKGYTPTTILYDVVTTFKNYPEDYEPHNYDGKGRGPVTVRQALQGSLNIPAVKMIYLTGISKVLDLADSLGYTTLKDRSRFGLSLVLGGGEVKLLEHTAAYATLANQGVHQDPVAVLKVEDANGLMLEEWIPRQGRAAIDPKITATVTGVLQDNGA
ncbi:MAG: transglycosylase domain-containing protein, partial [bacterium]|nr:transglycosylase domain-containing protein [bacterium]